MITFDAWSDRMAKTLAAATIAIALIVAAFAAGRRALWYDEFFTRAVASAPDAVDVVRRLLDGADVHPPVDYLARHVVLTVLGGSDLAFRIPSVLAFGATLALAWTWLRPLAGAWPALAALQVLLASRAFEYAWDGRPYALLLAIAAGSFLAWSRRARGAGGAGSLVALAAAFALAPLTHFYGVVLYPIVAVAEAVRARRRRRVDAALWLAGGGGAAAGIALAAPFALRASEHASGHWTSAGVGQALASYAHVFPSAGILLGCAGLALVLLLLAGTPATPASDAPREACTTEVVALVIAANATPFLVLALSMGAGGVFYWRYTQIATLGVAASVAILLGGPAGRRATSVAVALALTAGAWAVAAAEGRDSVTRLDARRRAVVLGSVLERTQGPVVAGTRSLFMALGRYGPPSLASRLVVLVDEAAARRETGSDGGTLAIRRIAPYVPGRVEDYTTFAREHERWNLVTPSAPNWILPTLLGDGAEVGLRWSAGEETVYEVRTVVPGGLARE